MDKDMSKKYAMLQIDAEIHQLLKQFCKDKGYKMNGLVESLIKEKVSPNVKPLPNNVLRSK
jgi:predicted HicB family RNase H-like nuclease